MGGIHEGQSMIPDNSKKKLEQLRQEMALRAQLQQQYDKEMSGRYNRDMIPFTQWLDQRQQNKADGGLAKFLEPSKVKNRAYHGTQSDFREFKSGPRNRLVKGMWFAQKPDSANFWAGQSEGANVMPVHLQFKNPAKREEYERMLDELPYEKKRTSAQRASQLKKRGFDSLVMNEGTGDETYIALHPHQIKSAIGNRGTYDVNDPDITKAEGGKVEPTQDEMRLALSKGGSSKKHNFVRHKHGEKVGGYDVGDKIKNFDSYGASGIDHVEKGVHRVPMSAFEVTHPNDLFYAKNDIDHVHKLAEQIKQNKYMDPLLVAMDKKGAYVLEGGHRLGAAHLLGMKEIPAIIGHEPENYAKGGKVEVRPTVKDEALMRKIPEMEAAAKKVSEGKMSHEAYDKVVAKHKPVKPYEFVPKPASDEDAHRALMENKKPHWRGHENWPAGRKVGLRLDIPAYENHGVWVNSIHDEEGKGEDKRNTSYGSVSSVKNATFDAGPTKAIKVATGEQNKSPFARIKGDLHHMTEDEAVKHIQKNLNHPDYAQVGMDPRRHGYFYDRKTMKPVTHAKHVVQIGPLVLAHKPTYGERDTYAQGGAVKPFDYENPKHVENVANLASKHRDFNKIPDAAKHLAGALSQGSYKFIEDPRIQSAIKQAGHSGYFINGKEGKQQIVHKAVGGSVLPMEQMKAQMMNRFKGLSTLQSIGADEAPSLGVKAYVPTVGRPDNGQMPVGGVDTQQGALPVGGIDMNNMQQGQQLMPNAPPSPAGAQQGMDQVPQGDKIPTMDGTGMPPNPNANPNQMGSNILSMTPQGQAMAAMKPQGLKKGGKVTFDDMRKALFAKGGSTKGYVKSTPKKPHPEVGTRFTATPQGNLVAPQVFDIMKHENKGSIVPVPYDATSRDNLVTEVSGHKLTEPLLTEAGFDYAMDPKHVAQAIGGASNLGIAGRVQDRINQAAKEHEGDVFLAPNTMSEKAENFSHHPAHIVLDLMKQRQLNKKTLKALSDDLRSQPEIHPTTKQKIFPYKNFVGFDHPNLGEQVMKGGHGLQTTAGNLRKKMMDRLSLVNIQELLDYNLGDLKASILHPDIASDPKGYMGRTLVKAQAGAPLRLSRHKSYDTDYTGTYAGGIGNRPIETVMPDLYEEVEAELKQRPVKKAKSDTEYRNQVIGALEKRKERVAQPINARVINNAGLYEEGLRQGEFDPKNLESVLAYYKRKGGYKAGGKVKLHTDQDTMQLALTKKSKKAK